jgi:hypothetical protein
VKKRFIFLLSVSLTAGVFLLAGGPRREGRQLGRILPHPTAGGNEESRFDAGSVVASAPAFKVPTALSPEKHAAPGVSSAVPVVAAAEADSLPADPDSPGNFLTFAGRRVAVESWSPHPAGPSLDLLITAGGEPAAAVFSLTTARAERNSRPGLTYEQELFRTKWGWAAFEQVQRAAREEAAVSHP